MAAACEPAHDQDLRQQVDDLLVRSSRYEVAPAIVNVASRYTGSSRLKQLHVRQQQLVEDTIVLRRCCT